MKGYIPEEVLKALTITISTINCKLTEGRQNDQHKKHSVFNDLQNDREQQYVAFMAYDLAII